MVTDEAEAGAPYHCILVSYVIRRAGAMKNVVVGNSEQGGNVSRILITNISELRCII